MAEHSEDWTPVTEAARCECPNCGQAFEINVAAVLPAATELTLSLDVEPGQMVRLDTISGVLASWRDLQIAVGESMGAKTEVFLANIEKVGDQLRFTTRITNAVVDGAQVQS